MKQPILLRFGFCLVACGILSGILLLGAFPPFDFFPLAWIAFVPLFFAMSETSKKFAMFLLFMSQFLVFLFLLHWLSVFGWYAWVAASAYESLFPLVWGWIVWDFLAVADKSIAAFLFAAISYSAMEVARNLGPLGMPWGDLAYTQWRFLPVVEPVKFFGVAGLSFLILLANLFVFCALKKRRWSLLFAAFLCFVLPGACGFFILKQKAARELRVALIQTNDPQTLKWSRSDYEAMLSEMNDLVNRASNFHPDLVVFPETALAGYLNQDERLRSLVRSWAIETRAYLLVGGLKAKQGFPQNALFLVEPDGIWRQDYEKVKLVPFGEYLPFLFRPFRGRWHALDPIVDFKPGDSFTLFHFSKGNFGAMICFESSFGWISRKFARNGASFLVVSTNDAWFEGSIAQEQHAVMAIFRAAETGRSIVQAGNTGISCMLDPWGRILAWQKAGTGAVVTGEIPLQSDLTFYDRFGRLFPYFWIGAALIFFIPVPGRLRIRPVPGRLRIRLKEIDFLKLKNLLRERDQSAF